jgi:hypothetical protein
VFTARHPSHDCPSSAGVLSKGAMTMSATFNKMMIVGTSVLALLVMASGAAAAPSLGLAKGRPYYGSSNQGSGSRSWSARSYAPAFSTETRRSFSYEPAEGAVKGTGGCPQHAAAPQAVKKDTTKNDVAAAPKVTRRSYSYEPAIQPAPGVRNFNRNAAPKKELWQYPKTDPRRYNH